MYSCIIKMSWNILIYVYVVKWKSWSLILKVTLINYKINKCYTELNYPLYILIYVSTRKYQLFLIMFLTSQSVLQDLNSYLSSLQLFVLVFGSFTVLLHIRMANVGCRPLNFPVGFAKEGMPGFKKFGCFENRKFWQF